MSQSKWFESTYVDIHGTDGAIRPSRFIEFQTSNPDCNLCYTFLKKTSNPTLENTKLCTDGLVVRLGWKYFGNQGVCNP